MKENNVNLITLQNKNTLLKTIIDTNSPWSQWLVLPEVRGVAILPLLQLTVSTADSVNVHKNHELKCSLACRTHGRSSGYATVDRPLLAHHTIT
jgi:hypothetical protein